MMLIVPENNLISSEYKIIYIKKVFRQIVGVTAKIDKGFNQS